MHLSLVKNLFLNKQKQVFVEKYIIPTLTSTTSEYGTANNITLTKNVTGYNTVTNPFTMQLAENNHIPAGATVIFTIATYNHLGDPGGGIKNGTGCTGIQITYTYTDDITEVIFNKNNIDEFSGWRTTYDKQLYATVEISQLTSKEVKTVQVDVLDNLYGANRFYPSASKFTLKAQYFI